MVRYVSFVGTECEENWNDYKRTKILNWKVSLKKQVLR